MLRPSIARQRRRVQGNCAVVAVPPHAVLSFAQVANTVLQAIVTGQLVAGAKVFDICKLADEGVTRLVSQLYKSKKS